MRYRPLLALHLLLALCILCSGSMHAQCARNHAISENGAASQHDCQPLAELVQLAPEQMSPAAQELFTSRRAELVQAAAFYGYDIDSSGWTYRQSVSPMLRRHILLSYTNAEPAKQASNLVAILPLDSSERVQVVPSFAHGLRLFDPGWQKKGTYSVFNRLLRNEYGTGPIPEHSQWINYAPLYLALTGLAPAVPTQSDSVQATWDLSQKRATTPVILFLHDGGAEISFSDLSDPERSSSWKLIFNKRGQITKAEREEHTPVKVRTMLTRKETESAAMPPPSALNP